jgi:hypothetical protein
MVIAAFATFIIIVTGSISIATFGKFDQALTSSISGLNYKYRVELNSPTTEGGSLNAIDLHYVGTRGETRIEESEIGKVLPLGGKYFPVDKIGNPKA